MLPMIAATFVSHICFRMNILKILGLLTGGMTSTPGLAAATPMTKSNAPNVMYAAVYPIALVLVIICCKIIVAL